MQKILQVMDRHQKVGIFRFLLTSWQDVGSTGCPEPVSLSSISYRSAVLPEVLFTVVFAGGQLAFFEQDSMRRARYAAGLKLYV